MGLFDQLTSGNSSRITRVAKNYREKLREEAKLGGTLFGPIAPGGKREFFCFDTRTWLWHEEWVGPTGARHHVTTKFDVQPYGVRKYQNGVEMSVTAEEAVNLLQAAKNYQRRASQEIYSTT